MIKRLSGLVNDGIEERVAKATEKCADGIKDNQAYWKEVGRVAGLREAKTIFNTSLKRFQTDED